MLFPRDLHLDFQAAFQSDQVACPPHARQLPGNSRACETSVERIHPRMEPTNPMPCSVVHLTSGHDVSDARIFHKECRSLARAGYKVTLIGQKPSIEANRDGVKVCIIPEVRNRGERFTRALWYVYQAALHEDAEIYHFHDPELMLVGALLRMRGRRVIYDVHEDVGRDVGNKGWIPGLLRGPVSIVYRALETAFTLSFDRVIAVTPAIARNFPAKKTRLVRNFPRTDEFNVTTNLPYEDRDPIAVYTGGLHEERGLREMRQAVELAAKEVPIKLVVAGWVNPGEKDGFLRGGDSERFEFKGMLNRAGVAELLGRAKVGMLLFYPLPNHVNALPTKLFEYMAAGLPMVISDFPSWRELLGRDECALFVDPLSPAAVADALLWILRHPAQAAQMGENGRRAVAGNFNWERESASLLATYGELQPLGRERTGLPVKETAGFALQAPQDQEQGEAWGNGSSPLHPS